MALYSLLYSFICNMDYFLSSLRLVSYFVFLARLVALHFTCMWILRCVLLAHLGLVG